MLKLKTEKIVSFIKRNYFMVFAVISLLIPDIMIRSLIQVPSFEAGYVLPVSVLFSLLWIFIFINFCRYILPDVVGRIVYVVLWLAFTVLAFCQNIYYRIFEQFFPLESIAVAGEGADYIDYVINHMDARLIIPVILALVSVVATVVLWKKPKNSFKKNIIMFFIPVLGVVALHIYMIPEVHGEDRNVWDCWRLPTVVYTRMDDINKNMEISGLYQCTARGLIRTVIPDTYSEEEFERVENYFEHKEQFGKNDYSDMFKGKNVIIVMMESIDTWMISKKYTPTLYKMMRDGINMKNYYSPCFGVGHTFNAEFAFNTGCYTPRSAVNAANFTGNSYPYALPKLFKDAGYRVNSYHFNEPNFYNRSTMHEHLGYESYNSFVDLGVPAQEAELDSNILKYDAVFEHMTAEAPFCDFVITYSAHLPYSSECIRVIYSRHKYPHLVDEKVEEALNNCLLLAADTDEFFRQLLERLEQKNILKDTVIIGYTDHYAYGYADGDMQTELKRGKSKYLVPSFIYAEGIRSKSVTKPMMTIDWLPTIVNLFGLETEGKYLGNDILAPENKGFVYFDKSEWIDDKMFYDPTNFNPYGKDMSYIEKQNEKVKELFDMNDIIVGGDYYDR